MDINSAQFQKGLEQAGKFIIAVIWCLVVANNDVIAQQKKYYISASGNDNNDGLSQQTAWRSILKTNSTDFKPGDSVLFEGGASFVGTIKLTSDDNGSLAEPVVFTSYGKGRAAIDAGADDGLLAINTSFLKILSLDFIGSGVDNNKGSGIHFFANDSLQAPSTIEISQCDTKGFKTYGIVFGANDNIACKGYEHVRIINCKASENGQGGIASYGSQLGYQNKDFYVAYCKAFNNRGILTKTQNHTGNGIVMGMVDSVMIEYCEAYENGADNRCDAGGPVGIWVWMCRNAIIQHCIAHDNHTGSTKDGGGFDIDGGASNCILQYNYSYNNEGAGYLLAEYGASFPFTNNTIRFNISANDGRKNNYGAITVWGADSSFAVTNSFIYNNTIYLDDKNLVNGTPAIVTFLGPHFKNLVFANNIFVTKGDVNFINSDTFLRKSVAYLLHNNYYSYSNQYLFKYGSKSFSSIQQWLLDNNEQEHVNNKALYLNVNPLLANTLFYTGDKNTYILQKNSLLRKHEFSLTDYFNSIDDKVTDIGGNNLPANKKVVAGAFTK